LNAALRTIPNLKEEDMTRKLNTLFAAAVLTGIANATMAFAAQDGTPMPQPPRAQSSLSSLLAEWDRAAFGAPSKPSQYRVYGQNGYVTSGREYNVMLSLIRAAVNDSQEGRDREAVSKIASARHLLAASHAG
jgi:hypothetical protein